MFERIVLLPTWVPRGPRGVLRPARLSYFDIDAVAFGHVAL